MSLTIDEAIARFEQNAEQNERWVNAGLNPEANAEYAAEHRQLAAWLRELAERRKAPEIVRCGECKHRDPEDKKCDCGHGIIWQLPRDDDWFCADAERRTDGENLPE